MRKHGESNPKGSIKFVNLYLKRFDFSRWNSRKVLLKESLKYQIMECKTQIEKEYATPLKLYVLIGLDEIISNSGFAYFNNES